jgi:hypothetical protein
MHSPIHLAIAHESARARTERRPGRSAGARPFAAIRARISRARDAAAPAVPSRAAPGV